VTIEDAEVQGKDGTRVESFELIRATLAMGNAARIRPRLINADVSGGALSYVEDANGDIVAGLGLPDSVGQVGPVYRNSETENSSLNLKKYFEDLEFIQIRNANLYIKNAVSGIDIQSNIASMSVALSDDAGLTLTADGVVEQPSGQMPFSISSILGEEFQDMKLRMSANKLRPDEIAPKKGRFWDFQGLAAPVDLTLSVDFSRLDGLRSAESAEIYRSEFGDVGPSHAQGIFIALARRRHWRSETLDRSIRTRRENNHVRLRHEA